MTRRPEEEYVSHCKAVVAARKAAEIDAPTPTSEDPWWEKGPHIEKDGRSYYVHKIGCLQSNLNDAIREHPDWYLVAAVVRGRDVEVHGLGDDDAVTLGEIHTAFEKLELDEDRWTVELMPSKKGKWWA